MKNIFLILFITAALTNCNSVQKEDEVITVNFSTTSPPAVEIVKVIPLETRPDALIDKYPKMCITSKYYVVGDDNKIIVYSKDGAIHTIINARGEGPQEADRLSKFYADDHSIMIMDSFRQRIIEYDYDGNFITPTKIGMPFPHFVRHNDSYFFDLQVNGTDNGNVLAVTDLQGNKVQEAVEIKGKGNIYGAERFQIMGDVVLYLPSFYNTIYEIDNHYQISPRYTFDFGKHWAEDKLYKKHERPSDAFALWRELQKNDQIGFLRFVDSERWILLDFEKEKDRYNWFYNKEDRKQYMVKMNDVSQKSILTNKIETIDDGNFVILIEAYKYSDYSDLPDLKVSEEDNFVLVLCKIK
ncbi:MAG: 6-bladed beta-propeller [Bacteroidales bacterium]|nr:6-bladed beta-propeller [Bacteroidales bacterium]